MRSAAAASDLERLFPGLRAFAFDGGGGGGGGGAEAGGDEPLREALGGASRVFSTVPPAAGGEWAPAAGSAAGSPPPLSVDPVLAAHGPLIFSQARFVGYVSSTSVYGGDLGGERVDEFSKLKPDSAAGAARSRAEGEWREAAAATLFSSSRSPSTSSFPLQRLAIVRAGGIYGPGRSVLDSEEVLLADSVSPPPSSSESEANGGEKGSETDATSSSSSFISNPSRQQPHEANRPTARVHVLDLCRLLRAQAVLDEREGGGEEEGEGGGGGRAAPVVVAICNAVDGAPVPRSAALRAARELLGVQGGEKAGGEQDEQGGRRGEAPPGAEEARRGKVVSGERTWADAGIAPLFPSVFEGLRAILAGDARPFGRGRVPQRRRRRGGGERGGGGGRGRCKVAALGTRARGERREEGREEGSIKRPGSRFRFLHSFVFSSALPRRHLCDVPWAPGHVPSTSVPPPASPPPPACTARSPSAPILARRSSIQWGEGEERKSRAEKETRSAFFSGD